jgi:phosphoesterase RecJ-like protein
MSAVARAARAAGKRVDLVLADPLPQRYAFLLAGEVPAGPDRCEGLADAADAIVVLDTSALAQLRGLEEVLRAHREKVIVIDHHATSDDVGSIQWLDASAAATGVLVRELLEDLRWPLDRAGAEALATAILSDTGWLRFPNTDGRCLRAVAGLFDAGVRPDRLYAKLYQSDRPQRLRLLQRVLGSLELHCDGRLAVMSLRRADFQETAALGDETENLVNEALRIATVEAAVLLAEHEEKVRVNLRSREWLDVSEIARGLGGGGHARAAGLTSDDGLEATKARLIQAIRGALERAEGPRGR